MPEISRMRLWILRGAYLFVAVGTIVFMWPGIIFHPPETPLMNGVVSAMLGAVTLGALLGLRDPLGMLPVLLFELAWKAIWLAAFAAPLWAAGALPDNHVRSVWECLFGVVFAALIIPWPYVVCRYIRRGAQREAAR